MQKCHFSNSKLYTNKTQILFLYMEYSLHQNYLDQCYVGGDLEIKKKQRRTNDRTVGIWELGSGTNNKHSSRLAVADSRIVKFCKCECRGREVHCE